MPTKISLILIVVIPVFLNCTTLKQVHDYAALSVTSLNKINDVNYTFDDYCRQDCDFQQLRKGEVLVDFTCDCEKTAENADKAIQKIHLTITKYLQAIERLSNNQGFTYDVSGLTSSLQQNPYLQLSEKQVSVSTKAGNYIAAAATTYYRKKKLNQYLGEADTLLQDLTETLIYLLDSRMRTQLKIGYDTRLANIKQQIDNAEDDKGLKQVFVNWYLNEKAYYQKHNKSIDAYVNLLRSVKKGHHELYLHRKNLHDKAAVDIIKLYAEEVQEIVSTIKS